MEKVMPTLATTRFVTLKHKINYYHENKKFERLLADYRRAAKYVGQCISLGLKDGADSKREAQFRNFRQQFWRKHLDTIHTFATKRNGEWWYYPDNFPSYKKHKLWAELVWWHRRVFGISLDIVDLYLCNKHKNRKKLPTEFLLRYKKIYKKVIPDIREVWRIYKNFKVELFKDGAIDQITPALNRTRKYLQIYQGGALRPLARKRLWVHISKAFKESHRLSPARLSAAIISDCAFSPTLTNRQKYRASLRSMLLSCKI
ncbi:MAG TPA: hypothetical protein DCL44_08725 [Elusimicrobia bacterium]|nr:hypothetical protein [Elusimicrobiota bacterium]